MTKKIYRITLYKSNMEDTFQFYCDEHYFDFEKGVHVFIRCNNSDGISRDTILSCDDKRVKYICEVLNNERKT